MQKKLGKFITLEGIEGVGKTTHLECLRNLLADHKIESVFTYEPGGTVIADKIREIVLSTDNDEPLTKETELLLMFAARSQHVANVIMPNLQSGTWVISSRFSDSSYAYQNTTCSRHEHQNPTYSSHNYQNATCSRHEHQNPTCSRNEYQNSARYLPMLEELVHPNLQPDLTILLDAPIDLSKARILARNVNFDRIELRPDEFFEKVRLAYLERAKLYAERFRVIDASQTIPVIQNQISIILEDFIKNCENAL